MDVGSRIAGWRKVRDMTQRELAEAVGVTVAAVYQWEGTGESSTSPSLASLALVAKALGVTMAEFWGPVPRRRVERHG